MENHVLTERMKKQFRIDESYTTKVINLGYKIHRVWSSKKDNYPNNLRELNVTNVR
jgi:hypothetical protein